MAVVRFPLPTLLLAGCALLGACAGEPGPLEVELRTPTAPDPLANLATLRMTVSGPGMAHAMVEQARQKGAELRVPDITAGPGRVIRVEGLGTDGKVLAAGSSAPFTFTDSSPSRVVIDFAVVDGFSAIEAELAQGRHSHTATTLADGRVVIVGGIDEADGNAALSSVELFDPADQTFSALSQLASGRGRHRAARVDEMVVLVGGDGAGGRRATKAEVYSVGDGTVRELVMEGRVGHTATALDNGKVLVVGGYDSSDRPTRSAWLIDPQAGTVTPEDEPPYAAWVDHVAVKLLDGRVLIAGGASQLEDGRVENPNRCAIYDPGHGSWTDASRLPQDQQGATGTLLADGRVLVVGGSGSGAQRAAIYDPHADGWSSSSPTSARRDHAATALGAGALIAGGGSALAERFGDGGFEAVGSLTKTREHFTLTALPNGTALAVGGRLGGSSLADAEIFNPR